MSGILKPVIWIAAEDHMVVPIEGDWVVFDNDRNRLGQSDVDLLSGGEISFSFLSCGVLVVGEQHLR